MRFSIALHNENIIFTKFICIYRRDNLNRMKILQRNYILLTNKPISSNRNTLNTAHIGRVDKMLVYGCQ